MVRGSVYQQVKWLP